MEGVVSAKRTVSGSAMRAFWFMLGGLLLAIAVALFIAERGYDRLKWSGDAVSMRLAAAEPDPDWIRNHL